MEELDDEELELLYERTCDVVSAIDEDGDGHADLSELTRFFETMAEASARQLDAFADPDAEPPDEEAAMIIEGAGDGEVIELEALSDLLIETFAEDMELLAEIEDLLRQRAEAAEAALQEKLAAAWAPPARDAQELWKKGRLVMLMAKLGTRPAAPEPEPAAAPTREEEEQMLEACKAVVGDCSEACAAEHETRDHELRAFFVSVRLALKRRKRRLRRQAERSAAEGLAKVESAMETLAEQLEQGEELEAALSSGEAEEDDLAARCEEFARLRISLPSTGCIRLVVKEETATALGGVGALESAWHVTIDTIVTSAATAAVDQGAMTLLIEALGLVARLPTATPPLQPLAPESVAQLCEVRRTTPRGYSHTRLSSLVRDRFARCSQRRRSTESSTRSCYRRSAARCASAPRRAGSTQPPSPRRTRPCRRCWAGSRLTSRRTQS